VDGHDPADVLLGVAAVGLAAARTLVRPLTGLARVALTLVPDSVPLALAERGAALRPDAERLLQEILSPILRRVVDIFVVAVDLNAVVARAVDLDAIVARVDIGAVLDRVDLDAVVAGVDIAAVIDRVDLDSVVAQVDIGAILDRVDIDAIAGRLDIDAIAAGIDIDAIAARIDIGAILDRVDVDAVVAKVDIDKTLARLDLAGISLQVIDAIDLPEILRQSTGTVATEAVRGVRAESVSADEAVTRLVDRVLRRARPEGPALP